MSPTYALAQAPAPAPTGSIVDMLIPLVLMFVVFYFLLIRPQQQMRKKHQAMIDAVKRGDTVVTAGGIVGKVTKVSEGSEITVEIANGVAVDVVKTTLTDVRSRTEPAEKK